MNSVWRLISCCQATYIVTLSFPTPKKQKYYVQTIFLSLYNNVSRDITKAPKEIFKANFEAVQVTENTFEASFSPCKILDKSLETTGLGEGKAEPGIMYSHVPCRKCYDTNIIIFRNVRSFPRGLEFLKSLVNIEAAERFVGVNHTTT